MSKSEMENKKGKQYFLSIWVSYMDDVFIIFDTQNLISTIAWDLFKKTTISNEGQLVSEFLSLFEAPVGFSFKKDPIN